MLRFKRQSLRQVLAAFGLVVFALPAWAITGEQAASLKAEAGQEFSDSSFILPNEPDYAKFASAMRGLTGAFIGVGTFRVLAAASYGHFDQVLFTDLDQNTVDFNQRQIEVLAQTETLPEFLASLLRRPELAGEIADTIRDDRYISASSKTPLALCLTDPKAKSLEKSYVHSLLSMATEDHSGSFLSSPEAFTRIHRIARAGRMQAIAVNLAGTKTLREIGRLLRAEHSHVGVLDVSNAPDYLHHSPGTWANFVENLRALPFSESAVINSTNRYHSRAVSRAIPWAYNSTPVASYLALASRAKYGSSYELTDLSRDLVHLDRERACRDLFRN